MPLPACRASVHDAGRSGDTWYTTTHGLRCIYCNVKIGQGAAYTVY